MPRPTTTWASPCRTGEGWTRRSPATAARSSCTPDYAEAHNNLGNALQDQGNLDEAVACYRRALELKPDYAEAHSNLGIALQDQGRLDEAIACYRRAMELKPDLPRGAQQPALHAQFLPRRTTPGQSPRNIAAGTSGTPSRWPP